MSAGPGTGSSTQAHEGVLPDVVTLAKGLGGGPPLARDRRLGRAAELLQPGQHGTTFGGQPGRLRRRTAVLDTIAGRGTGWTTSSGRARSCGAVEALGHPLVGHVRGAGLLPGIVLTGAARRPGGQQAAQDAGILVNAPAPDVVRLMPALNLGDDVVDAFPALPGILDQAADAAHGDGRSGEWDDDEPCAGARADGRARPSADLAPHATAGSWTSSTGRRCARRASWRSCSPTTG